MAYEMELCYFLIFKYLFLFSFLFYVYGYIACMYVRVPQVFSAIRGQRMTLGLLKLKSEMVAASIWVL